MFGNREMIDESSSNVIDEMDYGMVDDIKEEKRRGANHAGHLCDEGQSHETIDRRLNSAYNTTPRTGSSQQAPSRSTSPYPQPSQRSTSPYPKPAQNSSSPYPKPVMQQYTPDFSTIEQRPVQTTVVNGRTYERPADTPVQTAAMKKASKILAILLVIGFVGSCFTSFLMVPVCVVLGLKVMSTAKKCKGDDTYPVDRLIPTIVVVILITFVLSCAGTSGIKYLLDFLTEKADGGGY